MGGGGEGAAPRAVIFGCAGPVLDADERDFFRRADPLGFCLFRRNCEDPDQLRGLVAALRETVGRPDAPILIDQEGGRVMRLRPPVWPRRPAPLRFGELAARSIALAEDAARLHARLIAADLAAVGIDVNAAPVLDLVLEGADPVIGDRGLSDDPEVVAVLGRAIAEGLLDGGVLPVAKHLPGHGRALADSHKALPVVDASPTALASSDFAPFRALADLPWGMTAHILYTGIDARNPATLSRTVVIDVIRDEIGFEGVLVTDDISMEALAGPVGDRAAAAIEAGCDVVLHCNARPEEMTAIAEIVPRLEDESLGRLARASAMRRPPRPFDAVAAATRVDALLAMA